MDKEELIRKIKESKKYKSLSDEVIKKEIETFILKNKDWERYKEKLILKHIKGKLHKAYSSFQLSDKSKIEKRREIMLEALRKNPDDRNIINDLLLTNKSTKERLDFYSIFYGTIFKITGTPNRIVDIGCGLNPLAFNYMKIEKNKTDYFAYDIDRKDIDLLNSFFRIENINGKAELIDARDIENIKKLPNCDLVFMFKLVDVIEKNGHKYSEEMIKVLIEKSKFIVVSFATESLSGKKMRFAERSWIERMLQRIELKFEKISLENEIFYVINK